MKREIVVTAKTVEEAKAEALRQLGFPEDVEFTVLDGLDETSECEEYLKSL